MWLWANLRENSSKFRLVGSLRKGALPPLLRVLPHILGIQRCYAQCPTL